VTSVDVFSVTDCSGLTDLATLDASASAALAANPNVAASLQAQGMTNGDIVGYSIDGSSLVVYVRNK